MARFIRARLNNNILTPDKTVRIPFTEHFLYYQALHKRLLTINDVEMNSIGDGFKDQSILRQLYSRTVTMEMFVQTQSRAGWFIECFEVK